MDEVGPATPGQKENWVALVDPRWQPTDPSEVPPPSMIVGAWLLEEDAAGLFQPNPEYVPDDNSPSDPLDAVLRQIADGADAGGEVVPLLRKSMVEVGCDEHDQPLLGFAPDGVACVVVVTAAAHKRGIDVERWNAIPGGLLPQICPAGADIMLNPSGSAAFRLRTEALTRE
ncbi:type VII secretion system-associated protein [Nocardia sp. KC 131]|uniref:type VII secretion system-associated protein n=1 Tax=Nocardia arseniciresistens TaxID=3392119 RepID=UPI00398F3DF2